MSKRARPEITVAHLVQAMEALAPPELAETWDNVGLVVGEREGALERVLLAIDLTQAVVAEATAERCQAVVSYHPPIFEGLKRLSTRLPAVAAARAGIAVYSPHTALDACDGGTNDVLAELIGMRERRPLRVAEAGARQLKLVVFVPESALEPVSQALFTAGAGRIGRYSACSFRSAGTGTFFGEEGSSPAVGERGRLELTAEIRLETVLPLARIEAALAALRRTHPYEEPAFDLVPLAAPPSGLGPGRVGRIEPMSTLELVARLKAALGIGSVLVAGPDKPRVVRVALCAGAGGDLLGDALRANADVFVTGELKHHHALRAAASGLTVLCSGHSHSERPALRAVATALEGRLPGVACVLSQQDHDPFKVF